MTRREIETLVLYAAASLLAVAVGSIGLAVDGAAAATWARTPAAWLFGLVLAAAIVGTGRTDRLCKSVVLLAVVGLAATLASQAQSGVHRWIDVGPLHVNMAALLLPAAIVGLAALKPGAPFSLGAAAVIASILVIQPDASQATAWVLSFLFLLFRSRSSRIVKVASAAASAFFILIAWLRPDPLEPVREVEGIFAVLAGVSPALVALAAIGLAASSIAPLRRTQDRTDNGGAALAIYFIAVAVAPALGVFPVPLVGLGMSFPVGYWLGIALLCARRRVQ